MQGNIFINNSNKWISPPRPFSLHDWQILNNSVKIIRQNDLLLFPTMILQLFHRLMYQKQA